MRLLGQPISSFGCLLTFPNFHRLLESVNAQIVVGDLDDLVPREPGWVFDRLPKLRGTGAVGHHVEPVANAPVSSEQAAPSSPYGGRGLCLPTGDSDSFQGTSRQRQIPEAIAGAPALAATGWGEWARDPKPDAGSGLPLRLFHRGAENA